MAVLCEATSVVAKTESIVRGFDSFDAFKGIVPNKTLSADNEIVRVGFMTPDDVYLNLLTGREVFIGGDVP